MRKNNQIKNKRRKKRYFIVFLIVFAIFFARTSCKYSQRTVSGVVEAGDLSESILLMSEKSVIKIALQQEKEIIEARRIEETRREQEKREQEKALSEAKKDSKIAYLTFDDGPSQSITPQILDILKEHDIKATFFVVGNAAEKNPELIKRIYEEGHAIGNHSYSHKYNYIYRRVSNFISELERTEKVLKNILGKNYETKIIRFPGGSFGDKKAPFRKAVIDKGYSYYDWNSLNGDAEGHNLSKNKLVQRFKETYKGQNKLTILMHDMDAKKTTPESLPDIIKFLQEKGYEFDTFK